MTSFNLNHLFENPISQVLGVWLYDKLGEGLVVFTVMQHVSLHISTMKLCISFLLPSERCSEVSRREQLLC
jgi:hypothetical protein